MSTHTEAATPGFLHELVRRRYRYRQLVGIAFGFALAALARPVRELVIAGAVFALAGMLIRLWASGHVKKDTELATTGPYAYVRHPLYVGNHLIALGLCLASGLWWSLPAWLALAFAFYPAAIRREDARLSARFPEAWKAWRAETHALFPRTRAYEPSGRPSGAERARGEWSLRQSLVANGEPIYVAVICAALAWIWTRLA